jgi:hypothetical protein
VDDVIEWLLQGEPWVQYRVRVDLLDQRESSREVAQARKAMVAHPKIRSLTKELRELPNTVITSHKSAGHPLHKLVFAADLGLQASDSCIRPTVKEIVKHRAKQGPFQVLMNIPVHFGGTGKDQWAWALCDSPLLVYALAKLGLADDERVREAATYLGELVRENGWGCTVSPELGKFRGPGRKSDPCPFANLVMLQALAQLPEWRASDACRTGAETLLALWSERREQHPYMFFMGTDFCKLKAPLVWYDILHVLDVLTQFPWLRRDRRLRQMVDQVRAKADSQGRFAPESVWQAWQEWEFGQKREPSRWLTFIVLRIFKRLGLAIQ